MKILRKELHPSRFYHRFDYGAGLSHVPHCLEIDRMFEPLYHRIKELETEA